MLLLIGVLAAAGVMWMLRDDALVPLFFLFIGIAVGMHHS
jgi:hypothetical protein